MCSAPLSIYCAGHRGELQKVSPRTVIIASPVHHQLTPASARRRADTELWCLAHSNLLNPSCSVPRVPPSLPPSHRRGHRGPAGLPGTRHGAGGGRSWTVPGLSSLKSRMPVHSSMVLSLSRELESLGACESWCLPSSPPEGSSQKVWVTSRNLHLEQVPKMVPVPRTARPPCTFQ